MDYVTCYHERAQEGACADKYAQTQSQELSRCNGNDSTSLSNKEQVYG